MVAEFENLNYDTKIVADMIEKYPDLVDKLASYKTSDGKPLFSPIDIDDILYNCRGTIQKDPQLLIAELDEPGTVDKIATWSNRSYALFKKVPHYEANKTVAAQPAPKTEEPKSIYDKANQYVKDEEGYPQWLERRMKVGRDEVADMRTIKTINPHTNNTEQITYDAKGNEISREKHKGGLISTREEFLDSNGNVIKENLYDHYDGKIYEETRIERNGSETIEHGKRYNTDDGKVSTYYTRTRNGNDLTYIEYDANGNAVRKYAESYKDGEKTVSEITYKDGIPQKETKTVTFNDNSFEKTTMDYEKMTKVIKKCDKDYNVTSMSETGLDDEPEFFGKDDVIRRSADVWAGFPTMRAALTMEDFDVSCVLEIVNKLRNNPKSAQKIIDLKTPEGRPRFNGAEAAGIILNCYDLEDPKLMEIIMSKNPDGTYKSARDIWFERYH